MIDRMTLTVEEAAQLPIVTDADVEGRVSALVGHAVRRQLWMLFLDSSAVQLPMLVPIEDYPTGPDAEFAAALAQSIRHLMSETDAVQVVFVWERCLSEDPVPADRVWARALAAACSDAGVSVRAQLISHRKGVRWFASEDYL